MNTPLPKKVFYVARSFFELEAAGGILLVVASALALILANSPISGLYDYIFNVLHFRIGIVDGEDRLFGVEKSILHWINDGLMALFFLLVGLEIKRELTVGELSSVSKAILPVVAAVGGMAVPALVYAFFNMNTPETLRGWAIPGATDIAFALAVMSILGSRVPLALKVFLTAIAIIDDLGAILIIAAFYADSLHPYALLFGILPILGLFLLNRANYAHRGAYIILGVILWLAVLKSGVHATMAGVITALFIPISVPDPEERRSPAQRLEKDLHPWVSFLILPLFGFANAGVSFEGMGLDILLHPIPVGIALGLFIGKQVGVFGASWLAIKSGLCNRPDGTGWGQIYGAALLCGIGFTMSLFIGGLAFTGVEEQAEVRLGVLVGSLISAIAGYIVLKMATRKG
ncbi:MAG: Na+/H+ antiporter NhaA [Micavibrio aeruginosavorus]|uniref:Na(+)/H(+) antiporter NhaA n=1 Tax=Micavibrio aeruginosavorus TaxID=349221 RepID=A0A2W5Q1V7_9BACT|nr:MAG: Na+/H+ antiporter NhaA [Micavibrio aeruginosavorus]